MKRLPALMLSVFMLTLLCLPTSAANNSANMKVLGSEDIPVELNINDNNMVDVTIESQAAHFYDNEILGYQAQSYRGKSSKKEWWYVAASKNCPDTGRRGRSTISLKNLC